jgi:hypothetical protein
VYSDPSRVAVEVVAIYARVPHEFRSRSDEINGSTRIDSSAHDAIVHYIDAPLLGTLLFSNTRIGRPVDKRVAGLTLFEARPPPSSATTFDALGSDVVSDRYGRFYQSLRKLGKVDTQGDGSLRIRVPGGMPLSLALTDKDGKLLSFGANAPFTGLMRQREATQFYPGERLKQGMSRRLFNGVCAGCHGSISGRELDIGISVDVLTSASRTLASGELEDLH